MNLYENNIGSEGAQHLARALHSNVVSEVSSLLITYQLLYLNTDTHHTIS
jgi:hypothetical protein